MAVAAGKAATAAVRGGRARAPAAAASRPIWRKCSSAARTRLSRSCTAAAFPGPLLFVCRRIIACAVIAWQAFFFRVNPDELGVVMRFGKFIRQEPPGLHFRLPYPIEEVRLPKVTRQNIIEIGMRSGGTGRLSGAHARRARREPDAHRRREHRRHRLRRLLAHQGRGQVPVQHPEPRYHRERGGRERHARGRRPVQDPADPHRGAAEDRGGRAEADPEDARQLRRRHPDRSGASCRRSIRRPR